MPHTQTNNLKASLLMIFFSDEGKEKAVQNNAVNARKKWAILANNTQLQSHPDDIICALSH